MSERLRLRAVDAEDLAVLGLVLKDARAPLREMLFDPDEARFLAAFVRYRREAPGAPGECTSVLVVEHVWAAYWCGLEPSDPDREHRLLVLVDSTSEADEPLDPDDCERAAPCPDDGGPAITLYFDDGAAIRLAVDHLDCRLVDMDAPRPAHGVAAAADRGA